MGSLLTSHLRATYDAAVKECVETDVSDSCKLKLALRACTSAYHSCVRRESGRKGERHDSAETLTASCENLQ